LISTRDLSELPAIEALRRRLQQMAVLDAVFSAAYGTAQHEFHPNWNRSQQMGAIKDGGGDELFVHFTPAGCFIKGFAHESVMTPFRTTPPALWPGLFSSVPSDFSASLNEPAFDIPATTFVVWRRTSDPEWHTDEIKFPDHYYGDGSQDLLAQLVVSASDYAEWLEENYELEVNADIVASVFNNHPLTGAQLHTLNPSEKLADMSRLVRETGYPLA
jgi:hypothetical protein